MPSKDSQSAAGAAPDNNPNKTANEKTPAKNGKNGNGEYTADSIKGFWIPDYQKYLDHSDEIEETVNGIFAG